MLEFQLFRIRVILPDQGYLFSGKPDHSRLLKEAIQGMPAAEFRKGMTWHVGNVESIGEDGLYFRFGRTTQTTLAVFDGREFLDQDFESAPYTHVLADIDLELCVIAKKTRLAPRTSGIARQLSRLLGTYDDLYIPGTKFEIDQINDPEDFINHLRNAYAISKFSVWFSRPNPWDVEKDFVKPTQEFVLAANGDGGKTTIEGDQLNPNVLEDISRSAAATGDDVEAQLKETSDGGRVRKRLRGNPVVLSIAEVTETSEKETLLARLRALYRRIRHDQET